MPRLREAVRQVGTDPAGHICQRAVDTMDSEIYRSVHYAVSGDINYSSNATTRAVLWLVYFPAGVAVAENVPHEHT